MRNKFRNVTPLGGPGPVRNKSRLPNGVANLQQLVGDCTNPILMPHAADAVKKHGEISLAGEGYPTPSNQCWPQGVPYIFWDFWMEMMQKPDKVVMIYRHGNEVRWVRLNQPHPAQLTPSWHGDSVGHYEGDTLVIDTVGMKVGPFSMVDMYGTPQSPALHVIERNRLLDYEVAKDAIERNEKENFRASRGGNSMPTTGARCYSFISRSKMKTPSPCPGPRPSPIGPPSAPGRTLCAPKIRASPTESSPSYRRRTSRISKPPGSRFSART